MGKIGTMGNVVVALVLAVACLAGPYAHAAEKSYLTASVEVRGNGAFIGGQLLGSKNNAIAGERMSFRIDDREVCAQPTDKDGKATCEGKDLSTGKHKVRIYFAGNPNFGPSESVGEFEIKPEDADTRSAQIKAQVSESTVIAGGRATVVGSLTTKKGTPIYGVRVSAAADGGAQASSLTDDNGSFQIPLAVPNADQPTNVNVRVAFDGSGGQFPATDQFISVQIKPRSKDQPAPTQAKPANPATTPAAPASAEPSAATVSTAKVIEGPSLVSTWPMLVTAGVALALLGGLGYLAWRWHQRNNQQSDDDASLEDVAHFDDTTEDER